MPHYPKPYFKKSHRAWYVQVRGRQFNLGKDEAEAFDRYHSLMKAHRNGTLDAEFTDGTDDLAVIAVLDRFLDACAKEAAPRTYDSYRMRLDSFARFLKMAKQLDLGVCSLKPIHVLDWLDSHPNWSPGMRRGGIQSVQRAFNWAAEVGLIESSPVAKMRKPPQGRRDRSVTEDEFAGMMANIPEGPFKLLLRFAWLTGCRPQESIRIEARHCDLLNQRIVLPAGESKGKKRVRVIYLTEAVIQILEPLLAAHRTGPIFRNADGNAWTRFAVNGAFERLRIVTGTKRVNELGLAPTEEEITALIPKLKKTVVEAGVERPKRPAELREEAKRKLRYKLAKKHADKCCAYLLRHSYSTNALLRGVDPLTVSVLIGHANGAMLAKVYSHLSQHPDHLKEAAVRATAVSSLR